ncbi:MAG: sugar nucleotide-binding protein, partial [Gaiellaceae bacterium]
MSGGVLVTGASGILGDALLGSGQWADAVGTVHVRPSAHPSVTVDLRDVGAVAAALAELRPRTVVHTVALTDVDACERDPGAAFAVTVATTHNLASWLALHSPQTLLVYVSTDQVYPGDRRNIEERTQPLNLYGQVKRAAELAAAQAERSLVLRTNFFGHSELRPSYTDWIANAIRSGGVVRADADATFSALHLGHL